MKNIITLAFFVMSAIVSAQSRKGDFRLHPGVNSHTLYVSFKNDILTNDVTDIKEAVANTISGFASLDADYNLILSQALPFSEDKMQQMEKNAMKISGTAASVNKLRNIFTVTITDGSNDNLYSLAAKLEALDGVEYCSLMSNEPIKPPLDIAPVTPSFLQLQNYIGNDGVKMDYAWMFNLTGQGINVRDIEYGFNKNHEELKDVNTAVGPGITISSQASVDFTEHGTAVLGVLFAENGTSGTTGMAYGANEVLLYPEYSVQAGYNRTYAVSKALANCLPGDVVLYEMQTNGAQGEYGPAEYDNVIWDLTKAASDAGVVIIAAAGNGAENLDAQVYQSYRNRGDSGAVIVGAGSPDSFHDRLDYSTYGERVDVQGWGYEVYTTGYNDLPQLNNDFNQRYNYFSGTSSATPIVASCAIVLQSYYQSLYGTYMTGVQIRDLLKETGTPQGSGVFGNIGPLPDMQAAIEKMQEDFLSTTDIGRLNFIVYPNPVQDVINITGTSFSGSAKAEVFNALGQVVYAGNISGNTINVDSLSQGLYTIKISDKGKSATKKIVKK